MLKKILISISSLILACCMGYNVYTPEDHQRDIKMVKSGTIDPNLLGIWIDITIPNDPSDSTMLEIFRKDKVLNKQVFYNKKLKEFRCESSKFDVPNSFWSVKRKGYFHCVYGYLPPGRNVISRLREKRYIIKDGILHTGNDSELYFRSKKLEDYDKEMYDKLLKTDLPCMNLSTIYSD
ncbi:hypothetical protein [Ichthyobacterium seriolicida]|uniref:Lipoprotein n=1 Tax=Ichthyobacterium seriolicida TaxID=242600 RepID=A0A1J1E0S7_9FLAO|nr:hypothetical protein [Ichthyobacterium seriolicida]BAV94541.1 hypothetical protein JBKA6_0528 [Ichthyobacterium seriolicida]